MTNDTADTYRGWKLPKLRKVKYGYTFANPNAPRQREFAYSEEQATREWMRRVDYIEHEKALREGYDAFGPGMFSCTRCGALVNDVFLHNDWHNA